MNRAVQFRKDVIRALLADGHLLRAWGFSFNRSGDAAGSVIWAGYGSVARAAAQSGSCGVARGTVEKLPDYVRLGRLHQPGKRHATKS